MSGPTSGPALPTMPTAAADYPKKIVCGALGVLSLVLAVSAASSLRWTFTLDTPLMHYAAWLIDRHGFAPYRDLYDFNMPGSYLFHMMIGRTAGYGDLGFQVFDLLWSAGIFALTYLLVRPFGRDRAVLAVLLIGLHYFSRGPGMTLQRDWVIMLPVCAAVYLVAEGKGKPVFRFAATGLLFGLATTIKPHVLIGLVPLLIFEISREPSDGLSRRVPTLMKNAAPAALFYAGGAALPMGLALLWVWSKGGLPAFIDIMGNYLPLYRRLSIDYAIVEGRQAWIYALGFSILGGPVLLKISGAFGIAVYFFSGPRDADRDRRRRALLLFGTSIAFILYTIPAGKYWDYHWMPAALFLSMTSPLSLAALGNKMRPAAARVVPLAPLLATLPFLISLNLLSMVREPFNKETVEGISQFLSTNVAEGERVQPLDWTGGAVQAILKAKCVIATPYIYDFYFYHHISNPHIKNMRRNFIRSLSDSRAVYIVQVLKRPWPNGKDTTETFPELTRLIEAEYEKAVESKGFVIYRRKNGEAAAPPA